MDLDFDMPSLVYLRFGNIYSSSKENFNFKIFPDIENSKFNVVIWNGVNCCEESEILFQKEFELDDENLKVAKLWIASKNS